MQFRSKRQALHDSLSQTAVVHVTPIRRNRGATKSPFRLTANIISQIFANLATITLATIGLIYLVLIPSSYMPAQKLYTDLTTPEFARQLLHRNKILHEDRFILLFHPTGLFYSTSGAILTNDRVIIYWKSKDGVQIDRALFSEITRIDLIQAENGLFDSQVELTTKDATIQFNVSQYQHYDTQFVSILKEAIKNILLKRESTLRNPNEKGVLP